MSNTERAEQIVEQRCGSSVAPTRRVAGRQSRAAPGPPVAGHRVRAGSALLPFSVVSLMTLVSASSSQALRSCSNSPGSRSRNRCVSVLRSPFCWPGRPVHSRHPTSSAPGIRACRGHPFLTARRECQCPRTPGSGGIGAGVFRSGDLPLGRYLGKVRKNTPGGIGAAADS